MIKTTRSSRYISILAAFTVALFLCVPSITRAQDQNSKNSSSGQSDKDDINLGLHMGKDASAKDVGLPLYPGARRRAESDHDSSALNMGLWGGSTGFKMALLKMETNDSPDKVAAFYRKALTRYGKVLTCTGNGENADMSGADTPSHDSSDSAKGSQALECGNERHDKGEMELKAGTKAKQHVVGISKEGSLTTFTLIYIETRGLDNDK